MYSARTGQVRLGFRPSKKSIKRAASWHTARPDRNALEKKPAARSTPDFPADFLPDGTELVVSPHNLAWDLAASLTGQYVERAPRARNKWFRDSDIFRSVFERVVGPCIGAGLVGGEGFAVDASLIVADANKQRSVLGSEWSKEFGAQAASRATNEHLATLDDAAFGAASSATTVDSLIPLSCPDSPASHPAT